MRNAKILLIVTSIIFLLIMTFHDHMNIRNVILKMTDSYNSSFCFEKNSCVELPKGFLPLISGKNPEGTIRSYQWFIRKNDGIDDKLIPKSIQIHLSKPSGNKNILIKYLPELKKNIENLKNKGVDLVLKKYDQKTTYYIYKNFDSVAIYIPRKNISIVGFNKDLNVTSFIGFLVGNN